MMLGQAKSMNVPRVLGEGDRYRIEEQIGRGGMGAVYRAYDKNTDRQVAVKLILDVSSPDAIALFDKEWRILSELQHVNVVSMTDRGEFRDGFMTRPYFVMPFLRGKTLQQRIADSSTPLTVEEVVDIISAAAAGLHAAHLKGVVHRDVKPSNIFTLDSGSVVVIDFGVVHFSEKGDITTIKGTTPYIAPELFDPDRKDVPSPRSDLFSLGVVCYEALTRTQPFSHETTTETIRALLKEIPAPAYELNREVSLAISQVVQKAMAKNKNHRYATTTDFSGRLRRALRNEPLPEFDKTVIETRLKVVREAFAKGQVTAAQELLRGIEEEGFVDPAISNQRQKIDQVLEQKWTSEQLESVRLHRDVGDFDSALDKLDAVLKKAPGNPEAIREREIINSERLKRVLSDADRHMRSHDFGNARKSIEEARQIEPKDSSTTELLLELTRLEEADKRMAEQKEQLFVEAQAAMRGGHTTTALHKLDRLRELIRNQGAGLTSDRDAIYEHYHDEILTEHNRVRRAFEDAKQKLEQGKFAQVMAVCDQMLAMNPGHPLFVGMKLHAEDRERQLRLECVQGVCATLAGVPDLERQVGILQDALNRFPGEPQLSEMLRNVKGRRDLIGTLVAGARKSEDSGEYNSALDSWESVREFHPGYPNLDREIARVDRRRQEQIRTEKKSERIEEVERLVRLADYEHASALCQAAVADFPGDAEIVALLADTTDRAKRANEARQILAKSRELARSGRGDETLMLLRRAHALDRNNQEIRQFLGVALLDRAQSVLESDWNAADQLLAEAQELIPNDPAVKSIGTLIADRKQRDVVEKCLTDARRRALDGDVRGAAEQIDGALKIYPNDRRLTAERTKLGKQQGIELMPTPAPKPAPVQEQQVMAASAAQATAPFTNVLPQAGGSIFQVHTIPERPKAAGDQHVPVKEAPPSPSPRRAPFKDLAARLRAIPPLRIGKFTVNPFLAGGAALLALVIIAVAGLVIQSILSNGRQAEPSMVALDVTTLPEGAEVLVDGRQSGNSPLSAKLRPGEHVIRVSLAGYEPASRRVKAENVRVALPVTLNLIPAAIHVTGTEGTIALDEQAPVDAKPGAAMVETAVPGAHSFKVVSKSGETKGRFTFQPGEPPKAMDVTLPPATSLLVIANYGGKSTIAVQGAAAGNIKVDNKEYKVTAEGTEIPLSPGPHQVAAGAQVFPVEIGTRHDLNLVFMAAAPVQPQKKTDWSSEAKALRAKKKYVTAYSVVLEWLQAEPGNAEADALKKQLEWIRDNAPNLWK
jgi:serine/threonine protein kinase